MDGLINLMAAQELGIPGKDARDFKAMLEEYSSDFQSKSGSRRPRWDEQQVAAMVTKYGVHSVRETNRIAQDNAKLQGASDTEEAKLLKHAQAITGLQQQFLDGTIAAVVPGGPNGVSESQIEEANYRGWLSLSAQPDKQVAHLVKVATMGPGTNLSTIGNVLQNNVARAFPGDLLTDAGRNAFLEAKRYYDASPDIFAKLYGSQAKSMAAMITAYRATGSAEAAFLARQADRRGFATLSDKNVQTAISAIQNLEASRLGRWLGPQVSLLPGNGERAVQATGRDMLDWTRFNAQDMEAAATSAWTAAKDRGEAEMVGGAFIYSGTGTVQKQSLTNWLAHYANPEEQGAPFLKANNANAVVLNALEEGAQRTYGKSIRDSLNVSVFRMDDDAEQNPRLHVFVRTKDNRTVDFMVDRKALTQARDNLGKSVILSKEQVQRGREMFNDPTRVNPKGM